MACLQKSIEPPAIPERGRFVWKGFLLAILAAPLFGLIWAWAAEGVQSYFAPMILFPLLLGVSAGLSVVGLIRFAQVGHRPTILLAAVLAAAVAGMGQHYFSYLAMYYRPLPSVDMDTAAGKDLSALLEQIRPRPSFGEYLNAQARHGRPLPLDHVAKGWMAWLSWAIDALLVIAAAVVVTIPALRVPYCNRCGTWYRTIRCGKIDLGTAQRLAELLGIDQINHPRSCRYRLSACQGGCSPTRCELSWEESLGAVDLAQVWLDAASRNQVATILDGFQSTVSDPLPSDP